MVRRPNYFLVSSFFSVLCGQTDRHARTYSPLKQYLLCQHGCLAGKNRGNHRAYCYQSGVLNSFLLSFPLLLSSNNPVPTLDLSHNVT